MQSIHSLSPDCKSSFARYLVEHTHSGCCFTLFNAQVSWGSHSEVEAMRLLLRAALANTLNERFVYLCETTIPIYPPTVVYHQLMKETKSRIDACAKNDPEV